MQGMPSHARATPTNPTACPAEGAVPALCPHLQTLPRLAEVLSSRDLLLQCFEAAAEQDEEA